MNNLYKNKNGGLLINLLVTLSIIGILAAISIPLLKNYLPNLKLSLVTKDLTSDLRYIQQQTITEQKIHLIQFSTSTNSYNLLKFDIATSTLKSVILPAEVSFFSITGFTDNTIKFNPYGAAYESGSIVLANTSSSTKTINIKPSGYVELRQ
ncbi:hypothetical protein KAU09_03390 [Candidatus Parcubacteria bacterium]|nr:hypothetical protein [Candidatus Parcubacteria bacterium]